MRRYLLAGLVAVVLAMVALGYSHIGGDDGRTDDSSDTGSLRWRDAAGVVHVGDPLPDRPQPTPVPTATPTPAPVATPGPTDGPEPSQPEPGADAAAASAADPVAAPEPERGEPPAPQPEPAPAPAPATGTLVHNVQLTVYTCVGDSTGAYCPWGNSMACGKKVYRGAAACGWQWSCGQRFRIVGDPYDMIYTCEDRGGAVTGIDVWFMDYLDPATQAWRNALDGSVTIELLN